jgi:23S rRNA G2445 N2-methylase RlmL
VKGAIAQAFLPDASGLNEHMEAAMHQFANQQGGVRYGSPPIGSTTFAVNQLVRN